MTDTPFTNPTIDLMMNHVSVRSFTSEPVPDELVVHDERYSDDGYEDMIRSHDTELADFYRRRGRNLDEDAWSGPVARGVSEKKYTALRGFMEQQGFDLG